MKLLIALLTAVLLTACGGGPKVRLTPRPQPIVSHPTPPVVTPGPVAPIQPPAPSAPVIRETARLEPASTPPPVDLPALLVKINGRLQDIYFAYDRADLGDNSLASLHHNAALLKALLAEFPQVQVSVEGHCDERGSAAYNLALGDQRARRAAGFLKGLGLPASRFEPISYGNEMPQCTDAAESCWHRNRRAHFRLRP